MPAVTASVPMATAAALLNDTAQNFFTSAYLLPFAQQAHNELQAKMRLAAAPVMIGNYTQEVLANATSLTGPTDIVEPLRIFAKNHGADASTYQELTEVAPTGIFPSIYVDPQLTLNYWMWFEEAVLFVAATTAQDILMIYKRQIATITSGGSTVGITGGELYMAPRIAALACGAAGEQARYEALTQIAESFISQVILANKGRVMPTQGAADKS